MDKTSSAYMYAFGYRTALATVKSMVEASHTEDLGMYEEAYQYLVKNLERMEKNIREEME